MGKDEIQDQLSSLMTFLAVARLGRYTAAGQSLGINHATVSRRIAALEKALGSRVLARTPSGWETTAAGEHVLAVAENIEKSLVELTHQGEQEPISGLVRIGAPDAFVVHICTPAVAELQKNNPGLDIELISATQRLRQNRSGLDLEVVVGEPELRQATAAHIMNYDLQLYASRDYLNQHGTPRSVAELKNHRLNYYIESALTVDDLDRATQHLPTMRPGITSTNVRAHYAATTAGAGIGLLPTFMIELLHTPDDDATLVPLLTEQFRHPLSYWAVARQEALRNPAVQAVYAAVREYGQRMTSA